MITSSYGMDYLLPRRYLERGTVELRQFLKLFQQRTFFG